MDYDILRTELLTDPLGIGYANMSDADVAIVMAAKTRRQVYSRFCSLRAIATVLDELEYTALKNDLTTLRSTSYRVHDMVSFLEHPCSDDGATGGLDIGHENVRAFIDVLPTLSAEGKAKIKALAERQISRAEELGISEPTAHEINVARSIA